MLWFCKERICKEAHVMCSFTRNWGRPTPGRQNRPLPSSQSHTQILTVSPASFFVPQTRSPRSLKQWPENVLNKRSPQKVEGFEISRASASRGRPLLVFTGLSPWAAGVLRATEVVFVSALLQTFHWKYSLGRPHMRLSFESTFFSSLFSTTEQVSTSNRSTETVSLKEVVEILECFFAYFVESAIRIFPMKSWLLKPLSIINNDS